MAQQQQALEKVKTDNIFVDAEHFFEDFAKNTQEIAKRAFELFEERGRRFGNDLEDWLKAEHELLRRVPIEIKDADGQLNLRAEVPGFTAENLKVSVDPKFVTIKGETESKEEKKEKDAYYSEWKSNKIFRTINLPHRVIPDQAKATVKDGILTITIPKGEDKPNEVKVKPA